MYIVSNYMFIKLKKHNGIYWFGSRIESHYLMLSIYIIESYN